MPLIAQTWFDRLLGLSGASWSDPRASLGWRWPLPLWAWVLIILAAALAGWWSYRRMLGPSPARVALAALRSLTLLAVAALLVGPMLVIAREQVEPDWLIMLVDRSASMGVRDMKGDTPNAPTLSRADALDAALRQNAVIFTPGSTAKDRRVLWLGFDTGTYELDSPAAGTLTDGGATTRPAAPQGQATMIRTAIDQALQRAAGHPIAGIVMMTDGRGPQATDGDFVRHLRQQAVNVFTVPLGAPGAAVDLAIAEVEAPERAFVRDAVPVTVWLDHTPADASIDPAKVRVRLIDTATKQVLDERPATDANLREPVRLSAESAVAGPATWRVEVEMQGASAATPRELVMENNHRDQAIELIDRPLGVLYVEGYPRWEYRYLKNMLVREESIRASMMLISADRAFAQEGQLPIARLPMTAEELKPYDVIIIGDVPPGYFTIEQMALFRDHVALRGAGLMWIGGSHDTPASYDGTPLAPLLPMRVPASVARLDPTLGQPVIKPTRVAEALGVLRLRTGRPGGDRSESLWPTELNPLVWVQDLGELKRSAEVLATAVTGTRASPAVVRLRYGAGQSLYVGTDDTWRWRYGRGELYYEQFWIQLVRLLGRSRLENNDQRAAFTVSTRRADVDQPVVVELRLNDELLARRNLTQVSVSVARADAPPGAATADRLELLPVAEAGGAPGAPTSANAMFRALWKPGQAGKITLRVAEPALADIDLSQSLEVIRPDDELRRPTPDHARLQTLAHDTGGAVVPLDHLADLATLVPNRAVRIPDDIRQPLWNSYLALITVVVLLTLEWIGRKLIRLV
ncbi:MAG: hypothetical protein K8S99_05670 [Planctomycetes bacterium]|nr:hypothetical protein [Planctomycetota bacterium]